MNKIFISACFALGIGLQSAAFAADEITLSMSVGSPASADICSVVAQTFKDNVEKQSAGRLKINLVCGGALSSVGDTVDRVTKGIVDIGWDIPPRYGRRFGSLGPISLPGLYEDPGVAGGALWNAFEAGKLGMQDEGFKILSILATENGTIYLKGMPPSSTKLDGLKIAVGSPIKAKMISAMGGVPLSLKPGEYYPSISKGVANGTFTSEGTFMANNVGEVTDTFIRGPFGGGVTFFIMNPDAYSKLPDDLKKVIDDNSGHDASVKASRVLADNAAKEFSERVMSLPGRKNITLSAADLAEWKKAFAESEAAFIESSPESAVYLKAIREAIAAETASR